MSKIIEITKCSECPYRGDTDYPNMNKFRCDLLKKNIYIEKDASFPGDIEDMLDDCPLEDSKVFAHSVMMRPMHEFNGIMVDDVNITPPIFEDLDYEVDKEMRREFGKDTVTIKEWHEKCDKNRRYHEDMLDKVFGKDGIKEPSYDNSVVGSKSSDKY